MGTDDLIPSPLLQKSNNTVCFLSGGYPKAFRKCGICQCKLEAGIWKTTWKINLMGTEFSKLFGSFEKLSLDILPTDILMEMLSWGAVCVLFLGTITILG